MLRGWQPTGASWASRSLVRTCGIGFLLCALGTAASPPYSVYGIVLNDVTSQPVEGAFVVTDQGGDTHATGVKTGADGRFSFSKISSAQCTIFAEKQGFLRASRTFQHADTQQLEPGGSGYENIELRMVPQAAVAGKVLDSNREPLIGATVQLSRMY